MNGFKETEIGWIPEDWGTISFGEISEFKNGINFSKNQKGETGVLTIDVFNMFGKNQFVDLSNLYRVNKKINSDYILKDGDLLFVRSSLKREGVGWTSLFYEGKEPVTFCGFIIRARLKTNDFNPSFLTYYFRNETARERLISGSDKVAITNINQGVLNSFLLPLPQLPEQKKIAHILTLIQNAIAKQDEIIRTATELKKALMKKLFTEGLHGEKQKQTEIGLIPESWEVVALGNIVDFKTGKLNSNQAIENGKYPFFTCSQDNFWINHYAFDQEAILLSGNNARGVYSVKYYKGKFNAYQRTYILTIPDVSAYSYHFLRYALSSKLEELQQKSIGTSTKFLTLKILQNIQMVKPEISEQIEISRILFLIDQKQQHHEKKKQILTDLFKTMLNQLMTGRIRVNHLDFDIKD